MMTLLSAAAASPLCTREYVGIHMPASRMRVISHMQIDLLRPSLTAHHPHACMAAEGCEPRLCPVFVLFYSIVYAL
eukprot:7374858-Prymnesium_polylepis.1